jgi:hypothetical protein
VTTVRVKGLRSLLRATDAAGKDTKRLVRDELRKAAEPVRREAAVRFASTDARSAGRYGISVRRVGTVSVEQRLRRTTGQHPEFGRLQMRRALVPALEHNTERVVAQLDEALERLTREWGAGG